MRFFSDIFQKTIIALVFFLFFPLPSTSISRELIIMGVPKEPMRYIDENNKPSGIDIEIIDYIFKKLEIDYKVIFIKSSKRLEFIWQQDEPEVDMVLTYSHNDFREQFLVYAEESHIAISWHFFILKENEGKFVYNDFSDFNGLTMGATIGYAYTEEFWEAVSRGIMKIDSHPVNEFQIKKLLGKRFDIVPLNTIATMYQAKKEGYIDKITYLSKPLTEKNYFNTFVKKSSWPDLPLLVKKYDEILREMKQNGTLEGIMRSYGL
ncbi:putative amino acid ABC transporter, periplasmic amino acid-binding protein [Desulfamplus magnetovallimortis]|uniref:Putative amino acid ABC transporter, periplasmic amino acid-binding protein n=1 Tax=Desulfamplus magnetovallimortis TaxID=1246637 RepID=A0A1W1HJ25_9BACT|nr:transporter substrate-binding domain-containing protein [Desulfamplus magnetovallimortis]SLM32479.1 putative amino acid ABC transporter, periplasmic amino acid-binding protein [Desulfamplus magnetovallimortis]